MYTYVVARLSCVRQLYIVQWADLLQALRHLLCRPLLIRVSATKPSPNIVLSCRGRAAQRSAMQIWIGVVFPVRSNRYLHRRNRQRRNHGRAAQRSAMQSRAGVVFPVRSNRYLHRRIRGRQRRNRGRQRRNRGRQRRNRGRAAQRSAMQSRTGVVFPVRSNRYLHRRNRGRQRR